jgi:hypothetical protein
MMTLFVEQRPAMGLGLYSLFARTVPLSYRNKIMLVAFLGTHIPLLTLVAWYALASASSLSDFGSSASPWSRHWWERASP